MIAIISLTENLFANRASQDLGFAKEIDSLLEKGETQLDLTRLTNFKWTKVSLVGPYTTDESIGASMNI